MRSPFLAIVLAVGITGPASAATAPAPTPTPPNLPEIYHTVSRPLCSALATTIRPVIGMLVQNDATIAKSPPLFGDYIKMSAAGSDSGRDMSIHRLNNLVTPLVQNTLAIQKLLEDPSIFPPKPQSDDDKRLLDLKAQLLKTLATQQASLDIINGFVDTQQLGEMQHEGFGYLRAITGQSSAPGETTQTDMNQMPQTLPAGGVENSSQTPQAFDDLVLQAGLQPNQYEIDPTKIPGLAVGYNQIGKLKDGLEWTQDESKKAEAPLSQSVVNAARICGAQLPNATTTASPSPKP
jgi:hypothetical protein